MIATAFSQQVSVEAKLDTNSILVGDQTGFTLGMRLPENYVFTWPQLSDTLTANVEIVKKSTMDTLAIENGMMSLAQKFTITAFDSGYYVIPPVQFNYGTEGSTSMAQIETEPHLLNVFTVAVDTTQTFKPIKGPADIPYTFAEILPWLLIALGVILIAGLVIYLLVRREKNAPLFAPRPKAKLPPHKVALDDLDKLNNQKVWQQGHVKIYHSRITEIIRVYIEDSFDVRAVEMTTPEILESIKRTKISKKDIGLLSEMLELADLVKFAKFKPQPSENEKAMDWAYDFVKSTMRPGDTGEKVEGV
jgi:hypothetical protein